MNYPITFCLPAATLVSKHLVSGILVIRRLCLTVFSQLYSSLLTGALLAVVGAITLLLPCGSAFGQYFTGGGGDDNWMNAANWGGTLPTAATGPVINGSDVVVLYAGDTGVGKYLSIAGGSGGTADLTVLGTLTTARGMAQPAVGDGSIVTIDGGTWTVTEYSYWKNDATLVVNNGGTFNVNSTGYGFLLQEGADLKLYDGTLNIGRLRVESGSSIEIGNAGRIVVDGDETATIQPWVDAGAIFAMDPLATISVELVGGDTIVQAVLPLTLEEIVEAVHAASMLQRTAVLSNAVDVETLWPYNAWGDNMWALALLYLNERVEDANARLQANAANALSSSDSEDAFAYFGLVDYVKILALFNSQSPHFPGRLDPATEVAMKEVLWGWAKDFEEYWEPSRLEATEPEGSVWSVFASENHDLMKKGNNYIIFSLLAEDAAYSSLTCANGHTVAEYHDWYTIYFKKWLQARAASGLWMEVGAEYAKYSYAVLFNLYDLSPDPDIRALAKMVLDISFIEEAQISFADGFRGGGKSRYPRGDLDPSPGWMQHKDLFYGDGGSASHSNVFETSQYQVPDIAIFLRQFGDSETPFLMRNRVLGESVKPSQGFGEIGGDTFYIADDSALINYCWKTPAYMIGGTLQLLDDADDGYGDDSGITRQDRWGGIVFNDAAHSKVLPWAEVTSPTGSRVHNAYWQVQHENLMVAQKTNRANYLYMERLLVYHSPALTLTETNGWVFASTGDAWSAVKAVGGYTWGAASHEKWPETTFLIPTDEYAPIVFFAGSTHDGFADYAAFQSYVLNDIVLQETTDELLIQRSGQADVQFFTDFREPVINDGDPDNPYNASPTLRTDYTYDSPYLQTGATRSEVIAQWGEVRWVYDFAAMEIREPGGIVLNFGGDYVAAITNASSTVNVATTGDYDFDGSADDTARSVTFGTVWSPTASGNWLTPAGKSGPNLRYGKSVANLDSATDPSGGFRYDRIASHTSPNTVQVSGDNGVGTTTNMSMASAFYYDKADFLNGWGTIADLAFDTTGEISIDFDIERQIGEGRALVRNGTGWYLSADALIGAAANGGTLTIFPATSDFYPFDPSGDMLMFDTDNPGAPVSGATLTNITAIGLHMQHRHYDGTSPWIPYEFFTSFIASIDDPVTAAGWYAAWSQLYPSHDMKAVSDPDGDGVNNLLEYALGGDPTLSDVNMLAEQTEISAAEFVYVYNRRLDWEARGLSYAVQANTNLLSNESWTTDGVLESGFEAGPLGFESVTNTVLMDADEKFLRLQIEMND
jgi:hypothetical protein